MSEKHVVFFLVIVILPSVCPDKYVYLAIYSSNPLKCNISFFILPFTAIDSSSDQVAQAKPFTFRDNAERIKEKPKMDMNNC